MSKTLKQHGVHFNHVNKNTEILRFYSHPTWQQHLYQQPSIWLGLMKFSVAERRWAFVTPKQRGGAESRSWRALEGALMSSTATLQSWSTIIGNWQSWVKQKRCIQVREKFKRTGKNVLRPQILSIIKSKFVVIFIKCKCLLLTSSIFLSK